MKITCERGALDSALSLVIGRAKKNQTIPILSHILLSAADNRLVLTATDLEASCEAYLVVEVKEAGSTVVDAHRLAKLTAGFSKGAQIKIDASDKAATIKCGRSIYELPTLPPSDFPVMTPPTDPARFTLDEAAVKHLFETPLEAVEGPKGRQYLTGGYFHRCDKKTLSVVATNGHVLLQAKSVSEVDFPVGIIVPRASMIEIMKIANGDLEFACGTDKIEVKSPACRFTSKLIEGTYPDYKRVIPPADRGSIVVDRLELLACLRRLQILAEESPTFKLDWVEGEPLVITLRGEGAGEERLDAAIDMPSFGGIGLAADVLLPALEAFESKTIRMFMADAGTGVRVCSDEQPDVLAVCMPKRV